MLMQTKGKERQANEQQMAFSAGTGQKALHDPAGQKGVVPGSVRTVGATGR